MNNIVYFTEISYDFSLDLQNWDIINEFVTIW